MQKVVGSSPIIRSKKTRSAGFLVANGDGVSPRCVPEGFQNAGSCCSSVVFVDESAESVAALDLADGRWTAGVGRCGREQRESSVWPLAVVVRRVGAEYALEVAAAEVRGSKNAGSVQAAAR
jgi:hypothetical protein